jgi:hypothetical protein
MLHNVRFPSSISDDSSDTDATETEASTSDSETDASAMQKLIDQEENAGVRPGDTDERMLALTCAAISIDVDESMLV